MAVLILQAVLHLAYYAENVGLVFLLQLRVETAGGVEVSQLDLCADILDPFTQHFQRPHSHIIVSKLWLQKGFPLDFLSKIT